MGEGLPDRIEVGLKEQQIRAGDFDQRPHGEVLWLERLYITPVSPGRSLGMSTWGTSTPNHPPLLGQLSTIGAIVPLMRSPATSVVVSLFPCGKPIRSRSPMNHRRWLRVM